MDIERWEVGGEFDWRPIDDGPRLPWPEPHLRFALAQHALIAVVRMSSRSDRSLWMPDYFCSPVADVVRSAGIQVQTYADDPRWRHARWNTLRPRSGEAVLAVNYFGVRDGSAWREWHDAHRSVMLVDDHTHDPWSTWARTSSADYAIASLRKTLPIPDGAIVWSPAGHPLPERPRGTDLHGSSLKLAAMALKRLYLAGAAVSKTAYRGLQLDGEAALLAAADLRMAPWSEAMLGAGIPRSWRLLREANVRQLVTALAENPDFRPLFDSWPDGHAPYNGVLVFRDAQRREAERRRLLDHGVFAAIHWSSTGSTARVRDLSERILTVPIDHRYGSSDVGRVAALLNSSGERAGAKTRQKWVRRGSSPLILDASDQRWDEVLSRLPHDVYQTAAFHRMAEQGGEGQALLVVVESGQDVFAWPYLLRQVAAVPGLDQTAATDVGSVYGYAGPMANPGASAEFLERAWAEVEAIWGGQEAVSAFTRFHPILENQRLLPSARGVRSVGTTVSIDLRLTEDEAMEAYPRVLRQEILAGRRAGLKTEVDQSWTELPIFIELYHETMTRNRAHSGYFLTAEELMRLRSSLGDSARLLVSRLEDEIAAAGIFLVYGQFIHAHLVGTASRFRALSPLKVLLDDARGWAAEAGALRLHLGGGRGGRADSLMTFKARFSRERHPFAVGSWLLDETAYEDLCRRRAEHIGGESADPEFFPAYRAPARELHALPAADELPD